MRNSLVISIVLLFFAIGCNKPKAGDKPVLKLDDVNTHVPRNSIIRFTFSFASANRSDSLYMMKVVPKCPDSEFSAAFKVPAYPASATSGEIEINMANGLVEGYADMGSPMCGDNDTATFRFVLKDVKGNLSDTLTSPQIVIFE